MTISNGNSYGFLALSLLILHGELLFAQRMDTVAQHGSTSNHHIYYSTHWDNRDTIPIKSFSYFINDGVQKKSNPELTKAKSLLSTNGANNRFHITGAISITITSTNTTCGSSNGSFTVSATGGTPPYMYSENGYPFQSSGFFPSKAPGVYNVIAQDANGLTATGSVTLTNTYSPPTVNFLTYYNPAACTGTDGTITLFGTGGTPPYEFSDDYVHWQTSGTLTNLPASWASYGFFIKDANGCVQPLYPPFYFGYFCPIGFQLGWYGAGACGADGEVIVAQPQGGTPPYVYSMDGINYQTNPDFYNLVPALYTMYVKDATGMVSAKGFQLFPSCPIDVEVDETDADCGIANGSLSVTAANGEAPYQYSIYGANFQASNIFTGLPAGTYTVSVMDVNGEQGYVYSVIINSNCPVVTAVSGNETCNNKNGTITATVQHGTAPYIYSIDGINFQSSNIFSGLAAGTYTVTVKDQNNASGIANVTVDNTCISLSNTVSNGTCGNDNGSITIAASGGTSPYQFSVDGINFQAGNFFSDLAAGNYVITVKDANNLSNTANAVIQNVAGPLLTASSLPASCTNNDGQIICKLTGGTSPYQYSLNSGSFQSNSAFTGLDTGTYTATVKDGNGCLSKYNISVLLQNTITVDAGPDQTICEGTSNTLNASSVANSYLWSPSLGLSNAAIQNPSASPDVTTKYYVTASSGICSATDSVNVLVNAAPIADPGVDTSICFGKSIRLNGTGGNDFEWSPSTYLDNANINDPQVTQPPNTITYHLVVTDANGCKSLNDNSVTVTITPTAKIFAGNDTAVVIDQSLQLNAIDVNSSGFTKYTWSPPTGLNDPYISDPIANITGDITYSIVAVTPDGCKAEDTISIKAYPFSDIFVPNAFTPNGDGHNDLLRAVLIGIKEFKYFAVYNRYGQRIFYSNNPSAGWDGTVNSSMQNTNTFVWMALGTDYNGNSIFRKGTVVLIR